jgi:hypothetical protein
MRATVLLHYRLLAKVWQDFFPRRGSIVGEILGVICGREVLLDWGKLDDSAGI